MVKRQLHTAEGGVPLRLQAGNSDLNLSWGRKVQIRDLSQVYESGCWEPRATGSGNIKEQQNNLPGIFGWTLWNFPTKPKELMGKNIKICQHLRMYMYIHVDICVDTHVYTHCCVLNVKCPP